MARKQSRGQSSGQGGRSGHSSKSIQQVARDIVRVDESPRTLAITLATNPGWDPIGQDPTGGVEPGDPEVPVAERALILRYWQEISGRSRLSLQAWVKREQEKRGGSLPRLAADLLGLDSIPRRDPKRPEREQSPSYLGYRNELRKLQEYAQGKYKTAAGARQERIALLPSAEAGNPYAPLSIVAGAVLPRTALVFAIRGDWQISDDTQLFALKHTIEYPYPSPLHDIAFTGGQGVIRTVIQEFSEEIGESAELLKVYALGLQSREVKRARRVDVHALRKQMRRRNKE